MFCKYCGATIADDSTVCPVCGQPVAETTEAPAAAAAEKPTGIKKLFLLIGAIAAFVSVLLSVGLFFAGGIALEGMAYLSVTDFFDFSETGVVTRIFDAFSDGGVDSILSLMFSFLITYATIIVLVVELIKAIIAFIPAVKGDNYKKILKPAVGAFGGHAAGMLLFYSFNAASYGSLSLELNAATLAGLVLAAILIGVYLVMNAFVNGKDSLRLSFLLRVAFAACGVVIGGIIAGLASGPVVVLDGAGQSFLGMLVDSLVGGALSGNTEVIIYTALGFVSTIALICIGLEFIKRAMLSVDAAMNKTEKPKKLLLGASITALVMSVILVVAAFLYADNVGKDLDPAVPIVMAVFAVLGVVMYALEGKIQSIILAKAEAKAAAKAAAAGETPAAMPAEEPAAMPAEAAAEMPAEAAAETPAEMPAEAAAADSENTGDANE